MALTANHTIRTIGHYVYVPTFQTDSVSYEESVDETFEDFEIVNDYQGVQLKGWVYDENLTREHLEELTGFVICEKRRLQHENLCEHRERIGQLTRHQSVCNAKCQSYPYSMVLSRPRKTHLRWRDFLLLITKTYR